MVDPNKRPRFIGDQLVRAVIHNIENPWTKSSEVTQSFYVLDNGALVAADVKLGKNVEIGFGAVIDMGCTIGDNVKLGEMVRIGAFTIIEGSVRIYEHTSVGMSCLVSFGCKIGPNCHIGSDNALAERTELRVGTLISAEMLSLSESDQAFDASGGSIVIVDPTIQVHCIPRAETESDSSKAE